jgi:hypothetical protein
MKSLLKVPIALSAVIMLSASGAWAHPNYTGYSGAPGQQACSISCHHKHSFTPTVTVTGFPQSYVPGQQYAIAVAHTGGTTIKQFNCSVRVGTGSTNAGVIDAGTNSSTYASTGETNGVHFSATDQNSAAFLWTAPVSGTGAVKLYWAGLQGNLSSGADTQIVLTSSEAMTDLDDNIILPENMALAQNYPNPFNAETIIQFSLGQPGHVDLSISNILGQKLYYWSDDYDRTGTFSMRWDGKGNDGRDMPSGVYFYQLRTSEGKLTRQMMILR